MHVCSSNGDDRSPNRHYDTDIHYTFQLCQWILKPIGIYPFVYSNVSKLERALSAPLLITCCSAILFVIVPCGHYVLVYEKDINTRVKFLGPLVFGTTSLIKYIYLCLKGHAFARCIKHVERDWKMLQDQDHRDVMIKYITMGRNLITICAMFLYTGGLSYHTFMPLLSKMKMENVTIRPLTYPGYEAFFDVQQSPTYEIVYFTHCFYVMVTGNITMAAYSMATIFTSHACGQMKIQILRLEKLTNRGVLEKPKEVRLAIIVRDHVEILRFSKYVEKALGEICLMEVIVSTMLICLVEYYCIMEWATSDSVAILTYAVLLISFIFVILMFCYLGELLLQQGNKVASASYDTEWYNLPARKARDIVLLLAISKYPPKLTAGKIFELSLNMFGVILKSSLVYLNVLQTITEF
ncbi:odorant receptor 43a-like [Osmia bicornis bicornis]|uniref:odorant receptor 43a-like n=1 Tax=Osmia bicornis bicornis TaxID=1437191 RepID=UPI001EAF5D56|nr:odorant receptor 43a-like [Osmia bicornis bicornis]